MNSRSQQPYSVNNDDADVLSANESADVGSEDYIPDTDGSERASHMRPNDSFSSPKSIIRRKSTNRRKINE